MRVHQKGGSCKLFRRAVFDPITHCQLVAIARPAAPMTGTKTAFVGAHGLHYVRRCSLAFVTFAVQTDFANLMSTLRIFARTRHPEL